MDEREWLTKSSEPKEMLDALPVNAPMSSDDDPSDLLMTPWGRALLKLSDRKARLFACAVVRAMGIPVRQYDVEQIEASADGGPVAKARWDHNAPSAVYAAGCACNQAWGSALATRQVGRAERAALLREVFGNPYRPFVWLADDESMIAAGGRRAMTGRRSWLTASVLAVATHIYESRAFDELPVLADALEDAGCPPIDDDRRTLAQVKAARWPAITGGCCDRFADYKACDCIEQAMTETLLEHLRSPGPHVRGCWVVDLILSHYR